MNPLSSHLLSKNVKLKSTQTIGLPMILYVCGTWSLTFGVKHRLWVIENWALKRIFGLKKSEVTKR
jgi:hypothetical protein